jgi:ribose transport system ATP-binding protein
MKILGGIYAIDEGEFIVGGRKVEIVDVKDAQKYGISIIHQEIVLVSHMTIDENIFLGREQCVGKSFHINNKKMQAEAKQLMESIGVSIDVKSQVLNLSVAYQQLVQIARALAFGINILILDEPTASLTVQERDSLFRVLQNLQNDGMAIIYISHRMEEIEMISDRVSIMRDGNLLQTTDTKDISVDEIIKHMVGREVVNARVERESSCSDEVLLKVDKLTRAGEFRDISFELRKGEILGFAGLVGAGRTELVRAIYGVTKPNSGDLYWKGKKMQISSTDNAIRLGMGYVPEERRRFGIFPFMSVNDNLTAPILDKLKRGIAIAKKKQLAVTESYISKMGIRTPSPYQEIRNLSGGNQQKVIIARWLAKNVQLLILDEPTRGIDVNAKSEIGKIIRELADNGLSIIFISSELEEVISIADRIMVMHEGSIKGFVQPQEISQEDIMKIALS